MLAEGKLHNTKQWQDRLYCKTLCRTSCLLEIVLVAVVGKVPDSLVVSIPTAGSV